MLTNILELQPNGIIEEYYQPTITLDAWKGFQSRQGPYSSKETEKCSDGTVSVMLEGMEIEGKYHITNQQINAIRFLVEHEINIRDTMLKALFDKLPELKEDYENEIPDIKSAEEFKNHIGLAWIHLMSNDKDDVAYIGFEFGCDWEEEHGIGIMMHKVEL